MYRKPDGNGILKGLVSLLGSRTKSTTARSALDFRGDSLTIFSRPTTYPTTCSAQYYAQAAMHASIHSHDQIVIETKPLLV